MSSLAASRDSITEIDQIIATLQARRAQLVERLDEGASRTFRKEITMTDYTTLPAGLPVPEDDGAAAHLPGMPVPSLPSRQQTVARSTSRSSTPAGRSSTSTRSPADPE